MCIRDRRERQYKLHGILNGIDTDIYNPETDKAIAKNFSAKDPAGKKEDKADLQREFSLPVRDDVPIIGMVSRLVSHKGLDLVKAVLDELLSTTDVQLVVLGTCLLYTSVQRVRRGRPRRGIRPHSFAL